MDFTGERQTGKTLDDIEIFHQDRYKIALEEIRYNNCKTILDAGCGIGYGSYILSKLDIDIDAYDISQEAIEFAKIYYNNSNINYQVKDCSIPNFINNCYDVIIGFEFLEHLEYNKAELILETMLKNSKLCITSIPMNNHSPFHKFIVNQKEVEEFYNNAIQKFDNKEIKNIIIQDNRYYICIIGDK